MSYDICIKIARAYDPDALLGPVRGTGDIYDLSGLTFLQRESVPLLVDHDPAQQIGEVHQLVVWPFTDQRWIVARARLDTPPGWVKRGTKASFSSRPLRTYDLNGWRVVSRALIEDITIVSATHRPVEACAEVVLVRRHAPAGTPPAPAGATSRTGDIVIPGDGRLLRRPNIGQVLAVR